VVQQPIDGGGGQRFGHQLVEAGRVRPQDSGDGVVGPVGADEGAEVFEGEPGDPPAGLQPFRGAQLCVLQINFPDLLAQRHPGQTQMQHLACRIWLSKKSRRCAPAAAPACPRFAPCRIANAASLMASLNRRNRRRRCPPAKLGFRHCRALPRAAVTARVIEP
jgi:hypothetical protein